MASTTGGITARVAELLVRRCIDFAPDWARLSAYPSSAFRVEPLTGGLSNVLYLLHAPPEAVKEGVLPGYAATVVVRQFNPAAGELFDPKAERRIFNFCSDAGVGPRLLGYVKDPPPRMRFEEYIEGRTLRRKDLFDPDISLRICKRLARIHDLDITLPKNAHELPSDVLGKGLLASGPPAALPRILRTWLERAESEAEAIVAGEPHSPAPDTVPLGGAGGYAPPVDAATVGERPEPEDEMARLSGTIDLRREVEWFTATARRLSRTPVVFCHGDAQEGNWLQRPDGSLVLIDYEYGALNPCAYDLANLFCEMSYDYSEVPEGEPGFWVDPEGGASDELMLQYCRQYLDAVHRRVAENAERAESDTRMDYVDKPSGLRRTDREPRRRAKTPLDRVAAALPMVSSVSAGAVAADDPAAVTAASSAEILLEDCRLFMCGSDLLWTLWSIIQARSSDVAGFGYLEYGTARARAYVKHKAAVCEARGLSPDLEA